MIEYNNGIASTMLLTIGNAPKKILKTIFLVYCFLLFFKAILERFMNCLTGLCLCINQFRNKEETK